MPALPDTTIARAAIRAGFRGSALVTAVAVALAESGGNTLASHRNTNRSTDYGLWQINTVHRSAYPNILVPGGAWSDPDTNARMAWAISSQGRNWSPWVTYKNGRYRAFIGRARAVAGGAASLPPIEPAPGVSGGNGGGGGSSPGLAASPALSVTGGIGAFIHILTDPHTWLRVAMFIGGAALVVMALIGLGGRQVLQLKKAVL